MNKRRTSVLAAGALALVAAFASVLAQTSASNIGPPPIAQGIVLDNGDEERAADDLTAALNRKFPQGTPQSVMRDELIRQGFALDRSSKDCVGHEGQTIKVTIKENSYPIYCPWVDPNVLRYTWPGPALCEQDIAVGWTTDQAGRITTLEGNYKLICV